MPIYEYECPTCGNHQEILLKFNDKTSPRCVECHAFMKKRISASSFHLKGGGWAKDNYGLSQNKGGK